MLLENSFEVPAGIGRTWDYLLDVERVVPCMPGAELTETVDDTHWKGQVTIKLGPVKMAFKGKVEIAERDDEAHRVVLKASGMEQRGKGAASATITTTAEEATAGTRIVVVQDLKVQGQAAQMSRGMMQDVSAKLTKQFAECLEANLRQEEEATPAAAPGTSASRETSPAAAGAAVSEETVAADDAAAAPEPVPAEAAVRNAPPAGAAPEGPPTGPTSRRPAVAAKPVGGIGLFLGALWNAAVRFFKRLLGGRSKPTR
jgi:carbon monoxide dehydrogenase subunit G